jgi:dTDP-4-dehydrorhamnose 3,5-epimerase
LRVEVQETAIPDLLILQHEAFEDERGFFMELYRGDELARHGLPSHCVQLNHSRSRRNVVRGLHFQWEPPMGKLMHVLAGTVFLVAVDLRKGSPSLGRWLGVEVSAADRKQIWAPAGFGRGFCVLSEWAEVQYLCTGVYNRDGESGIHWQDPDVGVEWPVTDPVLSPKDNTAQTLRQWLARPESDHFVFSPGE